VRLPNQVVYASRTLGVACWRATLSPAAAAALLAVEGARGAFFSATPVPAAAKLTPGLVRLEANATHDDWSDSATLAGLAPHPRVRTNGVLVHLDNVIIARASTAASHVADLLADAPKNSQTSRNPGRKKLGHAGTLAQSWHSQGWGGLHPSLSDMPDVRGANAAPAVHELEWAKGFLPPFRDQRATGPIDLNDMGPFWRTATRAAGVDCSTAAPVATAVLGDSLLQVTFESPSRETVNADATEELSSSSSYTSSSSSWDACVVATLAFLSSQPEVSSVEAASSPPSQHIYRTADGSMRGSRRIASVGSGLDDRSSRRGGSERALQSKNYPVLPSAVRPPAIREPPSVQHLRRSLLLDTAVTAVQSGDNTTGASALETTPLWRYGVNGTGQLVAVTDSGFDDGSCFLRDEGAGTGLGDGTGFNSNYQV